MEELKPQTLTDRSTPSAGQDDDKNLAKRSFKAAGWALIIQFATQFIQILLGICMARLLSPDDYGVLGMLAIFWAVGTVFITGGFPQALMQRKEVSDVDYSSVFYYNMAISFAVCFAMLAAAPWIADFYGQPILRQTIMVSAWTLPIAASVSIQRVILSRKLKQAFMTISSLFAVLISGAIALLLAWRGYGVWALVWQNFTYVTFSSIFVFAFVRWIPKLTFSLKALASLFQFGSKLLLAGLLDAIFVNMYNAVIGKYYKAETLGFYEQARRYSTLWPHSIQGAISSVLFPAFSKIQDDVPRLRAAFKRSLAVSVFAIIFPSYLLCVLSKPFIELVLTPKWLPCVPYWWLLTCTIVLYPIHLLNLQLLNSRGRSDIFLYLEIIKKCLAVVSVCILIFKGIIPMLLFGILSSFICAYLNSYYTSKEIGYGLGKQLRDIFPYALLAAVACFAAWGCYRVIYPWSPWCGLILPAGIGCVAYIGLNVALKTSAFVDLASITGSRLPALARFCSKQKGQTRV